MRSGAVTVNRRILLAGTITAPLLLAGTNGSSSNTSQIAGPFLQSKFDAIVLAVRHLQLATGKVHRFRVDPEYSAGSLKPIMQRVSRGQGRGLVRAESTDSGTLRVVIQTRDYGHGGEAGFLYSVNLLKKADTIELGREWAVVDQVSRHWWIVKYVLG